MLKIAHISDLHLYKITFSPMQFFSKRWLGNLNVYFFRKNKFKPKQLNLLLDVFKKHKIDLVIVTGDISSTSLKDEFEAGKTLFSEIEKEGIKTFFLPGNHDHYTKKAHRKQHFYDFFENKKGKTTIEKSFSLKKDKIEAHLIDKNLYLINLDCSIATHLLSSRGLFSKKAEDNLKKLLSMINKEDKIILANHFPFTQREGPRRSLKRSRILKKIIKEHPNIKIYLHGHTHRHNILDLRKKSLPLVLDSGSTAHNNIGKWNLLDIDKDDLEICVFEWEKEKNRWIKSIDKRFKL